MILGLTGNILSGKSTTAKIFRKKGFLVIDADKISHEVFKEKYRKISSLFGEGLTRKEISLIAFSDKNKMAGLCGILHPVIIARIKILIKKYQSKRNILLDAPLLIESGLYKFMDKNIIVTCPLGILFKRAKNRGMSKNDLVLRLEKQLKESKKVKYADYVIKNNSTLANLKKEVDSILTKLQFNKV